MTALPVSESSRVLSYGFDPIRDLRTRVLVTLGAVMGSISAKVLDLTIRASRVPPIPSLVVVVVSLLVLAAIVRGAWLPFGPRTLSRGE